MQSRVVLNEEVKEKNVQRHRSLTRRRHLHAPLAVANHGDVADGVELFFDLYKQFGIALDGLIEEENRTLRVTHDCVQEQLLDRFLETPYTVPQLALRDERGMIMRLDPDVSLTFFPKRLRGGGARLEVRVQSGNEHVEWALRQAFERSAQRPQAHVRNRG